MLASLESLPEADQQRMTSMLEQVQICDRTAQIVSYLYGSCCSEAIAKFSFKSMIRNCLSQLYAKDITPDDKQELDEALQREVVHKIVITLFTTPHN
ncbi:Phosphoenolpyruvate carboxylase [Arachis hypogaea]|nr:Phosphoenolpyruvate carboxylase [Arachis hypogaea]